MSCTKGGVRQGALSISFNADGLLVAFVETIYQGDDVGLEHFLTALREGHLENTN